MSKRPAGALAGIAMVLLLLAPASGATRPRDTLIGTPSAGSARISASASASRYPIGDGSGATVAIAVTAACQQSCTSADPQRIADFLGTLLHGPEIERLTVQLDTPSQLNFDCGYGAQACYYGLLNKIVISGNDTPAEDGASREFVLAHEYGHHLARHRASPSPFPPAIDWGTARWSSHEHICRLRRARVVFPGSFGLHYYRDPGEAFAEAFARARFPGSAPPWRWLPALKPDERALQAIRLDALQPWLGRTGLRLRGRVPRRGGGAAVRAFRTPLDGTVSLRPLAPRRYLLRLMNLSGRLLRHPDNALRFGNRLDFTVCGQSRLRLAIRSAHRSGGAFRLLIQRP